MCPTEPRLRPVRLAATLALGLLVALAAGCSSQADRLQEGLAKGADFVRAAAWDKAHVEVRNVLQIDPLNAQAHFIAGQIAEGRREWPRAFGSYTKALELKPDFWDAKTSIARLHLTAGDTAQASQAISEVLAVDPRHLGARTLQAALVARRGDTAGAIAQALALLAERQPAPVEVTLLLAGLQVSLGDASAALGVVESALQSAPRDLALLRVAAQVAASASAPAQRDKAVDFFRRATAEAPRNTELWNAWATLHLQRREPDAAEAVLRASVKAQPEDKPRRLALLAFLGAHRPIEVAEAAYTAAIEASPKEASLKSGLVALYRAKERREDARRVLREMAAGDHSVAGLEARNQLAADLWQGGQAEAAGRLVDEVLVASPRDHTALILRSRLAMQRNDARSAVIDLRAAARDQPGAPDLVGLLAQAHRRAGEPQLAREVLNDAVSARPESTELRLLLVADLADAREFKAALSEVDAALRSAPRSLRAHEMKAQLALAQKDVAGAERVFLAYRNQHPADAAGSLRLGQFYAEQRRFDAALKEFEASAVLQPASPQPVLAAVAVLAAQRRFDAAEAHIATLEARQPGVLVQRLRGEVALARGDVLAADRAWRQAIVLAPKDPLGYLQLARLCITHQRLADALAVLLQGEAALPDALELPRLRAEALSGAERFDEAIAVYEALLRRAPEDDALANNLAYLLIEHRGDRASLERALALTQRFAASSNPLYLDSLGWARYQLGQYGQAVQVSQRAVELAPSAALLQLHLGLALHKSGQSTRARPHLRQALVSKLAQPEQDAARIALVQMDR